ncbi:hypothetical protein RT41_GL001936 [Lactococcus fujiensis JCM 16395]|uniref:Uncharacterized protein n=1 Tax=Lactococcus fujiensis JCM 16395 TaxID=1291764 RepID=A0A2A5RJH9_9LACT|nr:hypothetical protein RT41_GL001936 [Lactococcus fujiensis JCM 16395]
MSVKIDKAMLDMHGIEGQSFDQFIKISPPKKRLNGEYFLPIIKKSDRM